MENRYTEGIAFDGAAILDNGKPITIDEILKRLNEHDELVNKTNDIHDVSYSVFDHETIQRIRNSSSDAEVRRMIKTKIQKL